MIFQRNQPPFIVSPEITIRRPGEAAETMMCHMNHIWVLYCVINIYHIGSMASCGISRRPCGPNISIFIYNLMTMISFSFFYNRNLTHSIICFYCFQFFTSSFKCQAKYYTFHRIILSLNNCRKICGPQSIGESLYPVIIFLSKINDIVAKFLYLSLKRIRFVFNLLNSASPTSSN